MGMEISDAAGALRLLQTVSDLMLEAGECPSQEQLRFHILNQTVRLTPYDRAVLFRRSAGAVRTLGVSGQTEVRGAAALPQAWLDLLGQLKDWAGTRQLTAEDFGEPVSVWTDLQVANGGTAILWVPIPQRGGAPLGLWVERWEGRTWQRAEIEALQRLARGYGTAWRQFQPRSGLLARLGNGIRARPVQIAFLLALAVLLLLPTRLRVVAPCEVRPRSPCLVAAPLDGTIAEVLAAPEQEVEAGEILARYDSEVTEERLKVLRQQVEVTARRLERAEIRAFQDDQTRGEVPVLRLSLAQDRLRLRAAEEQLRRESIRAPCAGTVVLPDPESWRGRPVRTGEAILQIVTPSETYVRAWVPESDLFRFDRERGVPVVLAASPLEGLAGRIHRVAPHAALSPAGINGFAVEIEWRSPRQTVPLGSTGHAILYGRERVSVAYWLLRRPLLAVRRFLGI